jgi:hypothetical protein
MTKFLLIEPERESIRLVEHSEFDDALKAAGLCRGKVDHGQINRQLGITVFEFGLFMHPEQMHFTVINHRLYAGNAVVYGVGAHGELVDVDHDPYALHFGYVFLHGRFDVEAAILTGTVERPVLREDGNVIWRWPERVPSDFPKQ